MANLKTPIWQLSVEEFINLLNENSNGTMVEEASVKLPEKRYVYGIDGLAKLLNCSNVTAQKIKNSGKLNTCYSQIGRKIVFDADKVLEILQK